MKKRGLIIILSIITVLMITSCSYKSETSELSKTLGVNLSSGTIS